MIAYLRSMQSWQVIRRLDVTIKKALPLEAWEPGTSGSITLPASQASGLTANWMQLDGEVYLLGAPSLPKNKICEVPVFSAVDAFYFRAPAADVAKYSATPAATTPPIRIDTWCRYLEGLPDPLYRIPYLTQSGTNITASGSDPAGDGYVWSLCDQIAAARRRDPRYYVFASVLCVPGASGLDLLGYSLPYAQDCPVEGKFADVVSEDISDTQITRATVVVMTDPEIYAPPVASFDFYLTQSGAVKAADTIVSGTKTSVHKIPDDRLLSGQADTVVLQLEDGVVNTNVTPPVPGSAARKAAEDCIAQGAADCNIEFDSKTRYHVGPAAIRYTSRGTTVSTTIRDCFRLANGKYRYRCGGLTTTVTQRLASAVPMSALGPYVRTAKEVLL